MLTLLPIFTQVPLSELDFPAITVCPDWSTDTFATQTVYNMCVKHFCMSICIFIVYNIVQYISIFFIMYVYVVGV